MLLWLLRGCFGIIVVGLATTVLLDFVHRDQGQLGAYCFVGILAVALLTVVLDLSIRNKQITSISAVYFGLLLGFVLGNFFWTAVEPFVIEEEVTLGPYRSPPAKAGKAGSPAESVSQPADSVSRPKLSGPVLMLRLFIILICCYVTVSTLLQTKDEFRFIIPYVEFSKQMKGGRPLVLDTSVIIDGRIADICDTRIIDTKLVVPRFVLQELQNVADSSDKLKRNRGRRGLDMLKRMQSNTNVELEVHEANFPELRDVIKVDERLVVMAKVLGARVVTNDYNLNKIAQLQGVEVINLNELSNALKSVALPGEVMTVRIVKPGDQMGQGVGYLEDGTMVVVEQGRPYVGQEVLIAVTSVLQNPAGRMIFGRMESKPPSGGSTAIQSGPGEKERVDTHS
jgi:uncharacterized protein YacL